jgi:hypothetical protein
MNITVYSHEVFARFVLSCIIFGIASAVLYSVVRAIFYVPAVFKSCSLVMLRSAHFDMRKSNSFLCDFFGLVIIAFLLLVVSFLANSGQFRIISIPIFMLGFEFGMLFFYRIAIISVLIVVYFIKRALEIFVTPIRILILFLYRFLKIFIAKVKDKNQAKRIEKYTKRCYNDLEKLKQNGLLDHWFEVV